MKYWRKQIGTQDKIEVIGKNEVYSMILLTQKLKQKFYRNFTNLLHSQKSM